LGATKLDVTVKVVVPAAFRRRRRIFWPVAGHRRTMAVTLAAEPANLTLNPLESIQTMTAYIVEVSQGDTPAGTPEYRSIFAVGLALFVTTMFLNVLAQWFVSRVREKYE
jgi:phosphate transport system permease protein